jgi:hypothetical protein
MASCPPVLDVADAAWAVLGWTGQPSAAAALVVDDGAYAPG